MSEDADVDYMMVLQGRLNACQHDRDGADRDRERLRSYLTEIAKRIPGMGYEGVGVLARKALYTSDPVDLYIRQEEIQPIGM